MAVDKKISQLASGAPAQAGDEYVVARSGANYKLTLTNIAGNMPATTISSGNLTFSSTGQRITGDFGNATLANRVYFQNSTVNGNTDIMAVPNGTGTLAQVSAWSSNDPANSSLAALRVTAATDVRILSSIQGTGTFLPMTFYTGGSERMRLDTSGNLGINTASTGFNAAGLPLVVGSGSGNTGMTIYSGTAGVGSIHFGDTVTTGADSYRGFLNYNHGTNAMQLGTDATARMTIDSSGNVGIGTTSPGVKADINGVMRSSTWSLSGTGVTGGTTAFSAGTVSTDANWGMYFRAGTGSSAIAEYSFRNSADTERMRIDSAGKITDQYGNIRAVPQSGTDKTTSYTLVTTDVGRFIGVGSGGSITVPNSTFATGDVVSIFNNTSGNVTLTMSITTAYIGGTDADKNTITLATRGVATILFISGTVCVVNGNVS